MTRARLLVLLLVVLVCAGACQADVTVAVDADEDGSGTVGVEVVLDAEAVERLGGVESVETADLVDAGWTVDEPSALDGGAVRLTASKTFADPAELAVVLGEISGPSGP